MCKSHRRIDTYINMLVPVYLDVYMTYNQFYLCKKMCVKGSQQPNRPIKSHLQLESIGNFIKSVIELGM